MDIHQLQLPAPSVAGYLPSPPIELQESQRGSFDDSPFSDGSAPLPPDPSLDFQPGQEGRGKDPIQFSVSDRRSFWKLFSLPLYQFGKFVPSPLYEDLSYPQDSAWVSELALEIHGYKGLKLPVRGEGSLISGVASEERDGTLTLPRPPSPGDTFKIKSYWPEPSPVDLASNHPHRGASYTGPVSIAEIAHSKLGSAATFQDIYDRILGLFREDFKYSRSDFPFSSSALETFMLDSKLGNCQHFAGATVLLLQALGITSRVAAGFAANTDKLKGGSAHAWVEVFFPAFGWVTLDPTNEAGMDRDDLDPDEDSGGDSPELEDDYSPPSEEKVEFFSNAFKDVDPWARQFASGAKRIIALISKPRIVGAYESGLRINTSRLYGMATGDTRVHKRRNQVQRVPAKFIFGIDESGSIKGFRDEHRHLYDRIRFMVAEGLNKAQQDFAMFGWHSTTEVYKDFGDPYTDVHRDRIVSRMNARLGGSTYTHDAITQMRELAAPLKGQRTIGLLQTDGQPSPYYPDTIRREIAKAHQENLHVVALVYAGPGTDEDVLLEKLEDMFDRYLLLSKDENVVNDQLTKSLLSMLRKA